MSKKEARAPRIAGKVRFCLITGKKLGGEKKGVSLEEEKATKESRKGRPSVEAHPKPAGRRGRFRIYCIRARLEEGRIRKCAGNSTGEKIHGVSVFIKREYTEAEPAADTLPE